MSDEGLDGAVGGLTAAEARVRETRRKSAIRRGRKQFVYGEGIRMVRVWI